MAARKISLALLAALATLATGELRYEDARPWYARLQPLDNLKHGTEVVPVLVKKVPTEDKAFKKARGPFFIPPEADDPKLKEALVKAGAPYCQEISAKEARTDSRGVAPADRRLMTCYRCKDPKSSTTYEQCSYSSGLPQSRGTRSNSRLLGDRSLDSVVSASQAKPQRSRRRPESEKLPEPFRFSEDYFHPEASVELPAQYEKNIDQCERVVRDSMVCMVCKDPKTSGKYEQCSYVAQPNEKAYAYTKSSSFGGAKHKPAKLPIQKAPKEKAARKEKEKEEEEEEEASEAEAEEVEPERLAEALSEEETPSRPRASWEDKEGHGSHYVPEQTYHYPSYKDFSGYGSYEAEAEEEEESAPKEIVKSGANCKTVSKNGETCSVCTDPKTGGKSEQCNYSHEPKDKAYRYSKSKSFGYPESSSSSGSGSGGSSGSAEGDERSPEASEKRERESSAEDYGSYASEPSTLDYIKAESEKISKQVKGAGECREERRDSMVCTVCKDPKTGGDFEQCNYSYEPDDKVFAYSKSKHFGSPTGAGSKSAEDDYSTSEERPEETYSAPVIYPTGTSVLDYLPKASASELSNVYSAKKPKEKPSDSRVDSGFYDATMRRKEIEKIVKDMGAEDRSKCKKTLRGGMTCFKCADDKGFVNEECVFVTDPQADASTEASAPVATVTEASSTTSTTASSSTSTLRALETSTAWKALGQQGKRKTREAKEKRPVDQDEELEVLEEEMHEAEPYEYVAETRPVYDKVLGLTLPAYMLQKSPHEIEFDEIVENAKF